MEKETRYEKLLKEAQWNVEYYTKQRDDYDNKLYLARLSFEELKLRENEFEHLEKEFV